MRKILEGLVLAALAPITTFAISLSDLVNNPEQYTRVHQNEFTAVYVDNGSVKILKDEPPDYTIQSLVFMCDKKAQIITEVVETTDFHVSYEVDKRDPNTIRKFIASKPTSVPQNNSWTFSGVDTKERMTKDDMNNKYFGDVGMASLYWFKKYFDDRIKIPD